LRGNLFILFLFDTEVQRATNTDMVGLVSGAVSDTANLIYNYYRTSLVLGTLVVIFPYLFFTEDSFSSTVRMIVAGINYLNTLEFYDLAQVDPEMEVGSIYWFLCVLTAAYYNPVTGVYALAFSHDHRLFGLMLFPSCIYFCFLKREVMNWAACVGFFLTKEPMMFLVFSSLVNPVNSLTLFYHSLYSPDQAKFIFAFLGAYYSQWLLYLNPLIGFSSFFVGTPTLHLAKIVFIVKTFSFQLGLPLEMLVLIHLLYHRDVAPGWASHDLLLTRNNFLAVPPLSAEGIELAKALNYLGTILYKPPSMTLVSHITDPVALRAYLLEREYPVRSLVLLFGSFILQCLYLCCD